MWVHIPRVRAHASHVVQEFVLFSSMVLGARLYHWKHSAASDMVRVDTLAVLSSQQVLSKLAYAFND